MPQTCLIAAHDPWFIQLLRVYTEESGFRVVQAYQGIDVLPMIHRENPVVVLLQVDLPGQVTEDSLLQSIKRDPAACHIPVLLFSWQNRDNLDDLIEGAAAYLQEPVTYEAFTGALRKAGICA